MEVQTFTLSNDGTHLAMRRYAAEGRRSRGVDLVVRDLEQGTEMTLGNVADLAWSESGALLAMTIDVDGKQGNGVQLLDASTGTLRSLDASAAIYSGLVWRRRANDLAVLRSRTDRRVRGYELFRNRMAWSWQCECGKAQLRLCQ